MREGILRFSADSRRNFEINVARGGACHSLVRPSHGRIAPLRVDNLLITFVAFWGLAPPLRGGWSCASPRAG